MVSRICPVPGTDTSLNVTAGVESTVSVAVAVPVFVGVVSSGASSVTLGGIDNVGSVVSTTIMI